MKGSAGKQILFCYIYSVMLHNGYISDEELMKEVSIDLLSEEQREEARRINIDSTVAAVMYIQKIVGGLKTAKTYYDLYID